MSNSSEEHYPIHDEPTREFSDSIEHSHDDGFEMDSESSDEPSVKVPEQLGDYALKGVIGSGGMGQVFLAEHVRMKRTVAVKMLRGDRMTDQAAIDRFYQEVRAASSLMHPNIVAAFDAGESDGIHYLAMEYINGLTLTQIVSQNGPLAIGEAASVISQAGLGLLHAHRAGIVHRDVKPGNIMRSTDGTVKVLDLGLAQITTALRMSDSDDETTISEKGKLIGTLAYMSPEQLESPEDADPRSDIYSLGAVLYFLLTARPPFVGEYLDQVYGHRHGEIPDLMQARDDVDLNFANIFRRMMAKSPGERYASLDEVIDDLGKYADSNNAPLWLAEFTRRQTGSELSTFSGGSTSGATSEVLAVDVGMFYSAAAIASPTGDVSVQCAGTHSESADSSPGQQLLRMAIASDENGLIFGSDAMQMRSTHPRQVVHCLPMYIGKDVVDREVSGRRCPPEVLLSLMLKRAVKNSWPHKSLPEAAAVTVPSCYDQLHRTSLLQSAQMAGLKSVRLVDRSVAAVQSLLLSGDSAEVSLDESLDGLSGASDLLRGADLPAQDSVKMDSTEDELILFIELTGQAAEASVIRRDSTRLHQLANAGHWHTGSTAWLHRLVDLVSESFVDRYEVDPRKSLKTALPLQMACERAMNSLLLLPLVKVSIDIDGESRSVSIHRRKWLERASELTGALKRSIEDVCKQANVDLDDFATCVTLGPLLRIPEIRRELLGDAEADIRMVPVDRGDVARGAAACLAGELPGRGAMAMPPRCVTSQSIGIVVEDARGRRRILPIIPRGTALPARTNRRLSGGKNKETMTLSLVESSGVDRDDWQSLGRYDFEIGEDAVNRVKRARMIGFEVNVNGLLTCRAQTPGMPGSVKLGTLPEPMLSDQQVAEWTEWINSQNV